MIVNFDIYENKDDICVNVGDIVVEMKNDSEILTWSLIYYIDSGIVYYFKYHLNRYLSLYKTAEDFCWANKDNYLFSVDYFIDEFPEYMDTLISMIGDDDELMEVLSKNDKIMREIEYRKYNL